MKKIWIGLAGAGIMAIALGGQDVEAKAAKPVAVKKIVHKSTPKKMVVGKTHAVKVSFSPSKASNKTYKVSTSNKSIISVSGKKLKALKAGKAKITVKSANGKKAVVTVTVVKPTVAVKSVKFSGMVSKLTVGKTHTVKAVVSPSNATNKNWTVMSSNKAVVSVSGTKLKALKAGTAKITIKTSNGKTLAVTVTVVKPSVAVSSVKLTGAPISLEGGQKVKLTASLSPANATNKTVTFKSSATSVATVNASGNVTAVKAGTATITATAHNGVKASVKIVVTPKKTSIIRKPGFATDTNLNTSEVYGTPIYWDNRGKTISAAQLKSEQSEMWYVTAEMLPTVEVMEFVSVAQFPDEYFEDGKLVKTVNDYDIVAMRNLVYEGRKGQGKRYTVDRKFKTYADAEAYAKKSLASKPAYCIRETGSWRNAGVTPVANYYVVDYFSTYDVLDQFKYYGGDGTGYAYETAYTLGEYEQLFNTEKEADAFMKAYQSRRGVIKVAGRGGMGLAYGYPYAEKIVWTRNGKKTYHVSARDTKQDAMTFNSIFDEDYFEGSGAAKELKPVVDIIGWDKKAHRFVEDMAIPEGTPTYFK